MENCEQSGEAVDHWNRFEEDFALAQSLNLGAYRTSLEWSRIEPQEGVYDQQAIDHYKIILKAARERGLKIFLTLQHFTLPIWLTSQPLSGWHDTRTPIYFERFVKRIVPEYKDLVDYWVTINEPTVSVLTGYVVGVSPPGYKNISLAPRVLSNMLKGHARAYHAIHEIIPTAKVGLAHHVRVFDPYRRWHIADLLLSGWISDFWNHQFLKAIQTGEINFQLQSVVSYRESYPKLAGTMDFLGLNYYSRDHIKFDPSKPEKFEVITYQEPGKPLTDVGWEIYPDGFYRLLKEMARYGKPIFVTENGIADSRDQLRKKYLCEHLFAMWRAMNEGVDVRGYLHWALTDNFEWSLGRAPRFGLIDVDYRSMQRTVRPSAVTYSRIIAERNLDACQYTK